MGTVECPVSTSAPELAHISTEQDEPSKPTYRQLLHVLAHPVEAIRGFLTQSITTAITASIDETLDGATLAVPCSNCEGTGTITETRERRIDDLTQKQISFLFNAHLEREKAKWGDPDGSGMQTSTPSSMPSGTPSGGTPNVSKPSTSAPPVRGGTRNI